MIKFFRKIRYDFMKQNKMSKYFKYAIGEIILVVVGILIALSINNWNEGKKVKAKEVLTEIVSDLELNLISIDSILYSKSNGINKCMNSLSVVIEALEQNHSYNDSLALHFFRNFSYPDVTLKSSGYESLASIGLDLISNNTIRVEIGKYYTDSCIDLKAAYTELRDDFYHYMLDFRRTKFADLRSNNVIESLIPVDYKALKNDREYIESLKTYLSVYEYYNVVTLETKEDAKQLMAKIENYIKEH